MSKEGDFLNKVAEKGFEKAFPKLGGIFTKYYETHFALLGDAISAWRKHASAKAKVSAIIANMDKITSETRNNLAQIPSKVPATAADLKTHRLGARLTRNAIAGMLTKSKRMVADARKQIDAIEKEMARHPITNAGWRVEIDDIRTRLKVFEKEVPPKIEKALAPWRKW